MEECLSICFLACDPSAEEIAMRVGFRDLRVGEPLSGRERIGPFSGVASPA